MLSSRVDGGGGGVCGGGRRSGNFAVVVVVGVGSRFVVGGGRSVVGGGSRWFVGEVLGSRGSFGNGVVVVVAGSQATLVSFAYVLVGFAVERGDKPEVGTDANCHSNAGLDNDGCCTPAAMAPRAVVVLVDSNPSCSLAGAKVAAEVVELARSWHCMEVVGLGCLEGGVGSSALRRSSRLLPCWRW